MSYSSQSVFNRKIIWTLPFIVLISSTNLTPIICPILANLQIVQHRQLTASVIFGIASLSVVDIFIIFQVIAMVIFVAIVSSFFKFVTESIFVAINIFVTMINLITVVTFHAIEIMTITIAALGLFIVLVSCIPSVAPLLLE